MSAPEPSCQVCGRRARHHYLVRHGEGATAFWLCYQHDREAEQVLCPHDSAAMQLDSARMQDDES